MDSDVLKFLLVVGSIGFWINFAIEYIAFSSPFLKSCIESLVWGFALIGFVIFGGCLLLYFKGRV